MCVGRGVFCSNVKKKCVCLDGTKPTIDKRNCIPNEETPVGARCSIFCTDLHAICEKDSHRCRCRPGYLNTLEGDCRLAEFQDICKLDYDCRSGMKCLFGECHCKDLDAVYVSMLDKCIHRDATIVTTNCTKHSTRRDSRVCSFGYSCKFCPIHMAGYCHKESPKPTISEPIKGKSSETSKNILSFYTFISFITLILS